MAAKTRKTKTMRTPGGSVTTTTTTDESKVRTVIRTTTPKGTLTQVHTRYVESGEAPKSRS
jgi:hypothetical protein